MPIAFLISILGVIALYLVAHGQRGGWLVGIYAQVLWAWYSIITKQWGFLLACIAYLYINIKGLLNHGRNKQE
jgi:hypothetical protein